MHEQNIGLFDKSATYGGDAYTGIQNAAAQAANNITKVAEILTLDLGTLLLVAGSFGLCYFSIKLFEKQNNTLPALIVNLDQTIPISSVHYIEDNLPNI